MLKLNSICKNYVMSKDLTVNALKNVTLAFRPCEFVAVLGPSGCGKTTLLNIIGGLDHYTSGDLMINGKSTKEYTDSDWDNYRNKCIGFVFQSYNLIPHQTVLQNVELALTLSGISKADRLARAKHALDTVGLTTEYDKRPNQLSGGQMQRVAIARSIVNNPTILLADEPTGALDSETSIQVMNLLREIAKDRLVIMVTHNKDLADAYATRIVNLLDGQVVSDTLPLTDTELDAPIAEQIVEQAEEPSDKKVKTPKKKTSMSFLTALSLSFNNLMTKKGRTIMTSFAGSIGIVGVALILALNYGFNTYISKMQSDTLSGYPVTISKAAMDYDAIYEQSQNIGKDDNTGKFPVGDDNIHIYDPSDSGMGNAIHYNLIDKDYYQFINDFEAQENAKSEQKRLINGVQYSYASSLNLVRKQKTLDGKETYVLVKNGSGAGSSMETMMGTSSSVFQEALSNTDFVWSQYDKLLGEYPKNKNEVALIVDSRNRISTSTMDALGLQYSSKSSQDKITYEDVPFEDILHTQFSLIYNDLFYEKNDALNSFAPMSGLTNDELQVKLQELSKDNSLDLEVVGVLRVNENAPLSMYSAGILYLPSLTTEYLENCKSSEIVKAQTELHASKQYLSTTSKNDKTLYPIPEEQAKLIYKTTYPTLTSEQLQMFTMQKFGGSLIPSSIYIYPKNFEAKDEICKYLNKWNVDHDNKIVYTDASSVLSSTMGQMIDIISYVLIAIAGISLIVSSIMIGIITYVSVIERTKEIGVLRSLGARKKDVSRVFNAETILVGLLAGVIGVAFTYLLCFPLNAILGTFVGSVITGDLAVLNPLHSLILIVISVGLTLLSGLIPSHAASKLDPVKALRSE